jgi:hypothetical protein
MHAKPANECVVSVILDDGVGILVEPGFFAGGQFVLLFARITAKAAADAERYINEHSLAGHKATSRFHKSNRPSTKQENLITKVMINMETHGLHPWQFATCQTASPMPVKQAFPAAVRLETEHAVFIYD